MAAVAGAFAAGILLAELLSPAGSVILLSIVLVVALLTLPEATRSAWAIIVLIALAGTARYYGSVFIGADDISRVSAQVRELQGRVASDTTATDNYIKLILRVNRAKVGDKWLPVTGKITLNLYPDENGKNARVGYGDQILVKAKPYLPSDPTNPGQHSWKKYLARQGIHACASVNKPDQVTLLRSSRCNPMRVAFAVKHHLVRSIYRLHPAREASVMAGVVLGAYAYLDQDTLSNFTRSGTLHVLAASGYNCFVIILIATPMLKLLRFPHRFRGFVLIGLIGVYVLMVGPAPSMLRAAAMATLALIAAPLGRVADHRNLFFLAGFLVLLYQPTNLFDIGFQLSFLAVWALIWVSPVIQPILQPQLRNGWSKQTSGFIDTLKGYVGGPISREIVSVLIATIAVSLVTAPVIAYYFNYISLVALPANVAVVFTVPLVFFDSFLSILTVLIPHGSGFLGFIGTAASRLMLWSVDYLGSLESGSISMQAPGMCGLAGYYMLLYAVMSYLRSRYVAK